MVMEFLTILNLNKKSNMNKIEQILVLLLFLPVLHAMAEDNNGRELDRMHGQDTYDYGARQYDPILLRWDRIDPLCEKYYSVSPYAGINGDRSFEVKSISWFHSKVSVPVIGP